MLEIANATALVVARASMEIGRCSKPSFAAMVLARRRGERVQLTDCSRRDPRFARRTLLNPKPLARQRMTLPEPYASQAEYEVRFEWGLNGLQALAGDDPVAIVVDVLSFSTAVSVAVSAGGIVLPFRWGDARAEDYAQSHRAMLAGSRELNSVAYSLSPSSLRGLSRGTRIVLPSPNGSTICFESRCSTVMAGCLRNRSEVAQFASALGRPIAVVAAGERWPDGSQRFSIEDLLGAGAIISRLEGSRSPEAEVALAAFERSVDLTQCLERCESGRELASQGFLSDVWLAAEVDADRCAPVLCGGAFS